VVLTSASHDGAALATAMGVFGIGSVRGSSSRRGVAALVGMRKALREGIDVCVTPDGPRGPRYMIQAGLVKLAETSAAPVIPIHVEYPNCWRLKTWDRFAIPKPCSTVRVFRKMNSKAGAAASNRSCELAPAKPFPTTYDEFRN
jgi:lysophospholipid acyltransferase (LPLAT)-like uncharacterized protein